MKPLLILALIFGVLIWLYLLLGSPQRSEAPIEQTPPPEEPAPATTTEAELEIPEDAPPQTDAGMEFPTLE